MLEHSFGNRPRAAATSTCMLVTHPSVKENENDAQKPPVTIRLHSRKEATRLVQDTAIHAWLRTRQKPRAKAVARAFLSRHKLRTLKACFDALDTDASGTIEPGELSFALKELGLPAEHARAILSEGDTDEDGTINFDEFVALVGAVTARMGQRSRLLEAEPPGPSAAASAFTEMLNQAATSFPLGVLANAVHIREAVASYDPELAEARFNAGEVGADAACADGLSAASTKGPQHGGSRLPVVRGAGGLAGPARSMGSRATSAPLVKSVSYRRWLAQAGKTDSRMRIQSAATVRGKEHKPLLVPPPPAGLTHAATASRLPKILDVCPE
jgi:hypothetical protein